MSNSEDLFKKAISSIYHWSIEGDKVKPPQIGFPPAVKARIAFFASQMEGGLLFSGALELILAYDEQQAKQKCEMGGEWLPVSDEFRKWRDQPDFAQVFREEQIALALMYGAGMESNNDIHGV
ncbi:hypothetical protein LASUN_13240 [Lentilactobacillus sunkii]|jgi:hypothetical protein|uniref:Phage protein n=1 Tax=Lentilactobacillus sunkii TaxID=481719 RepID=A0A1E7XCE3_9LACO|nr:hypothetical protein [Lentilactobacillus sunkii]OFA10774.1 hypothetical protein LASUN_13240 [Lentilactobacillus sunkii]